MSTNSESGALLPVSFLTLSLTDSRPDLRRLIINELSANHSLTVARIPRDQVTALANILPEYRITRLSTEQLGTLASRLVSLFEFTFTPTAPTGLPIRVDVLLQRILRLPPLFLPNLLRQTVQWFGLAPDPRFHQAWKRLLNGREPQLVQEDLWRAHQERGLAMLSQGYMLMPLVALGGALIQSRQMDWDTLPNILHALRHYLLKYRRHNAMADDYYGMISRFLLDVAPSLDIPAYRSTRARGELVDLQKIDWSHDVDALVIDAVLTNLDELFKEDPKHYQISFRIQGHLWERIAIAVQDTAATDQSCSPRLLVVDRTNWAESCKSVSQSLEPIAAAYTALTEMERSLGIDRYLGSKVVAQDLEIVHSAVQLIRDKVSTRLESAREVFLEQWNLAQLTPTLLTLLGISNKASPLSDYLPNDQQRVIFCVIDGLGYTQFRWLLSTVAQHSIVPLAGNIFCWLKERGAFDETLLLASNPVTTTGTCLPTIYTGALPRETGILGSHMRMENHVLNVLKGKEQSRQRRLTDEQVAEIYHRNTNQALLPLSVVAQQKGVQVRVLHGGAAYFAPLLAFTYGRLTRDPSRLQVLIQADRIFSQAVPLFDQWQRDSRRKQLLLMYYPIVDSSGHPSGPYTQFQATELAKLNFLFTHFLLDLVEHCNSAFDGKTSVVITADHGMFESSDRVVNEQIIRHAASGLMPDQTQIIYDNRACFIYGIPEDRLDTVGNTLERFFHANGVAIIVRRKNQDWMQSLLCDDQAAWSKNCPDLILQFAGPGIFYGNHNLAPHMFLYGAHGGCSVEETFVPFIHFTLSRELAAELKNLYH